jgi:quercetin dioxygenase-like cupin family protein
MDPYSLAGDEGEAVWMFDALDTIKASSAHTEGSFTIMEFLDFEGSTVPLHQNQSWDRGFYLLEGDYTFFVDDKTIAASSGSWVFVPRGINHAWRCESSRGRLLNITVPGGFEDFYREVGESVSDRNNLPPRREPDVEHVSSVSARYGIIITGPPPGV